jgi:hypothetical protein
MTTNQKILITFALSALAFYVYTRLGKKTQGNVGGTNTSPLGSLGNGGFNPPQLQQLRDCEQKYNEANKPSLGPKPQVYISPEEEKRNKEFFINKCMAEKQK